MVSGGKGAPQSGEHTKTSLAHWIQSAGGRQATKCDSPAGCLHSVCLKVHDGETQPGKLAFLGEVF